MTTPLNTQQPTYITYDSADVKTIGWLCIVCTVKAFIPAWWRKKTQRTAAIKN